MNKHQNDRTQKLLHSETRTKQLKNHLDTLHEMARSTKDADPNDLEITVKVIGEVTKEEFKINRGTNTSARVMDMFDEARVQKILEAVEIGPDLTDEQKEQVHSLI